MVLAGGDMAALFGLDMADASDAPVVVAAKPAKQGRAAKQNARPAKSAAPPRNKQAVRSAGVPKGKAAAGKKRAGKRQPAG
jgi:hypothetical protein